MVGNVHYANNAEEVAFANMVDDVQYAINAEEAALANMVGNVYYAKNAGFANMLGNVENVNFVHSVNIARKGWTVQTTMWKLRIRKLRGVKLALFIMDQRVRPKIYRS